MPGGWCPISPSWTEWLTWGSSLDYIYRKKGAVPIEVVGKVAEAVLRGLLYLYDTHRIIHRGA